MILQAQVTSTATTASAYFDLLTTPGTPRQGMVARVDIVSHSAGTTGATVSWQMLWSPDGTAGPYNLVQQVGADGITPFTPGLSSSTYPQIDLPFILPTGARFIAVEPVFSATTGAPSVVWASQIENAWPG